MSGEAQQRCAAAAPRPNVFSLAEIQLFDGKADFLQAFGQQFLTALVVGGDGCAGDELFGKAKVAVSVVMLFYLCLFMFQAV